MEGGSGGKSLRRVKMGGGMWVGGFLKEGGWGSYAFSDWRLAALRLGEMAGKGCVCVCERERGRERERGGKKEREKEGKERKGRYASKL